MRDTILQILNYTKKAFCFLYDRSEYPKIYPDNFAGTLEVQGTMVGTSPSDNDYFTITTATLSSTSDVSTLNFTGVFQNVRFVANRTSGTTGRIDKILYRQ